MIHVLLYNYMYNYIHSYTVQLYQHIGCKGSDLFVESALAVGLEFLFSQREPLRRAFRASPNLDLGVGFRISGFDREG